MEWTVNPNPMAFQSLVEPEEEKKEFEVLTSIGVKYDIFSITEPALAVNIVQIGVIDTAPTIVAFCLTPCHGQLEPSTCTIPPHACT